MANLLIETEIPASRFVDSTSRYLESDVIYYGENNIITFKTYKRTDISFTSNDKFFLIDGAREFRPDLVSKAAYGITSFWWRILQANGMKDILDFRKGVTVRIPNSVF
jgi:restriction endonuclease S subunit